MMNWWGDIAVIGGMFPLIVADIPSHLKPVDAAYFRRTREARFGKPLEEVLGHARACPGHPRLAYIVELKDVDGRDKPGHDVETPRPYSTASSFAAAAFRRQSRHRQSSPSTGIGRRLVSSAHQHGPARLQVNSVPHQEQARRREAGFSNRFVMVRTESCP
jgi:hypothetical protein